MAREIKIIGDLIGRDLSNFRVVAMIEVIKMNNCGRKINSLGFFLNADTASVFSEGQEDGGRYRIEEVPVLTDGVVGFIVQQLPVKLLDDEEEKSKIRMKILSRFTPNELRFLGLV